MACARRQLAMEIHRAVAKEVGRVRAVRDEIRYVAGAILTARPPMVGACYCRDFHLRLIFLKADHLTTWELESFGPAVAKRMTLELSFAYSGIDPYH